MMAPPRRLSWWTRAALTALAERHGATVMRIDNLPWGTCDALFHWMERASPIRCTDLHYQDTLTWRAAALAGRVGGRLLRMWRKTPLMTDEGVGLPEPGQCGRVHRLRRGTRGHPHDGGAVPHDPGLRPGAGDGRQDHLTPGRSPVTRSHW